MSAEDVFGIVGTAVAGAFQVEAVVAEGGFGVVYRAYHAGFRAHVALKCLKIPGRLNAERQERFLEQFRAEAELLFRLSASLPTVVRPLHIDAMTTSDGTFVPYMALEWLDGETLAQEVERRATEGRPAHTMKKLARLLTPVARALERAHNFPGAEGMIAIVHRDLKPDNIFLAKVAGEPVVKILDFGIGKARNVASQVAGRSSQTSEGVTPFTPAYGAPEQWVPKRYGQTGPWTDVWGLALTMVEVLAARPILDGDQAQMMGTALDDKRRPTPRNEGVQVDDETEKVFEKALAVDPRERYADAGLFWDELTSALKLDVEPGLRPRRRRDPRAESTAHPVEEKIEAAMPAVARPRIAKMRLQAAGPNQAAEANRDAATVQGVAAEPGAVAIGAVSLVRAPPPAHPAPVARAVRDVPPSSDDIGPTTPSHVGPISGERSRDSSPSSSRGRRDELVENDFGGELEEAGASISAMFETAKPRPGSPGEPRIALKSDMPPARTDRDSMPASLRGTASSSGRYGAVRPSAEEPPRHSEPPETILRRFARPVGLILGGTAVALADRVYAAHAGSSISVGPVTAILVAGILVFVGVGMFVWKLVH